MSTVLEVPCVPMVGSVLVRLRIFGRKYYGRFWWGVLPLRFTRGELILPVALTEGDPRAFRRETHHPLLHILPHSFDRK